MTEDVFKTYRIDWQGIPLLVTHTPRYSGAVDHIEVQTEDGQPLPITETGYRSCFLCPEDLAEYESPAAFVRQWLDFAAEEGWYGQQFSLF